MEEQTSPIADFYPSSFAIDLNGKKFAWQGVALLPFIDEKRLLSAMALHDSQLTDFEKALNETGNEVIHIGQNHPLYESLCDLYGVNNSLRV